MDKAKNNWVSDELLELAKTDINALYEVAQLAIKYNYDGCAIVLLKAAKRQGHNEAAKALSLLRGIASRNS